MAILNVTPDSFSDGGQFGDHESAIQQGLSLAEQGADIIDVGGESTRPHAGRVSEDIESQRVLPVVRALANAGVQVSIDTMRARVAEAAVANGAIMINDVSGGLADTSMAHVAATTDVAFVAMHWRGHSAGMSRMAIYDDVVGEVLDELSARIDTLISAGVREERLIIDPGLGFAKEPAHNWELLAGLDRLHRLGRPLLVGASRKSFLGTLMKQYGRPVPAPADRDDLTCAVSTLACQAGAWGIRAHNVVSTRRAIAVAQAIDAARKAPDSPPPTHGDQTPWVAQGVIGVPSLRNVQGDRPMWPRSYASGGFP